MSSAVRRGGERARRAASRLRARSWGSSSTLRISWGTPASAAVSSLPEWHALPVLPVRRDVRALSTAREEPLGLFGLPYFHEPDDFLSAAHRAIQESSRLVETLENERLPPESSSEFAPAAQLFVRRLDLLSDTVCRIADTAEFCRHAHMSQAWRAAAEDGFTLMSNFIFRLNANRSLYMALRRLLDTPAAHIALTEEQLRVAHLLRSEFERDGIHLPDAERELLIERNQRINMLCTTFMHNTHRPPGPFVGRPRSSLRELPLEFASMVPADAHDPADAESTLLPRDPRLLRAILRWVSNPHMRQSAERALWTMHPENLDTLHDLARERHAVAVEAGYASYAELAIEPNMAENVQCVLEFLHGLSAAVRPFAQRERCTIEAQKRSLEGYREDEPVDLRSSDLPFYQGRLKAEELDGGVPDLREYFSLSRVLQGIDVILDRVFDLRLQEVPMSPTESWCESPKYSMRSALSALLPGMIASPAPGVSYPASASADSPSSADSAYGFSMTASEDNNTSGLRKMVVWHPDEGICGVIFLDLFGRPGKVGGAAQYVLRCGRAYLDGENAGPELNALRASLARELGLNELPGGQVTRAQEESYQLPVVALVTNYSPPSPDEPVLLSHHEMVTLFHEVGHALHSLLSRTEMQHAFGTRGPLDFVEIPSHVMENFARDPRVVKEFARHVRTGQAPPERALARMRRADEIFSGMDTQQSIVFALFDQALFSDRPMGVACSYLKYDNNDDDDSNNNHNNNNRHTLVVPQTLEELSDGPVTPTEEEKQLLAMTPETIDSSALVRAIQRRHAEAQPLDNTHWQTEFTHIVNYAGVYYSYLWSTMCASALWNDLFDQDPLNREAGRRYRHEVLAQAGREAPERVLRRLLGREPEPKDLLCAIGLDAQKRGT